MASIDPYSRLTVQPGQAVTLACSPAPAPLSDIMMFIRKRGALRPQPQPWLTSYPATDVDDDGVLFLLDSRFWSQPFGRYEAELRYRGSKVYTYELEYRNLVVKPGALGIQPALPPTYGTTRPAGAGPMFDDIQFFSGALIAPLERTGQVLTLSPSDTDVLKAATLLSPVELILTDGVRTEIVRFAGAVAGQIYVTRAQAGTSPLRFPIGSQLRFAWTGANMKATTTTAGEIYTEPSTNPPPLPTQYRLWHQSDTGQLLTNDGTAAEPIWVNH